MGRKKKLDKLTLDSIAAEKAGMSYGRWKAQNPGTTPKKADAGIPKGQHKRAVCAVCGGKIPEGSSRRKYCGDECAHSAFRVIQDEWMRKNRRYS